ncbi:ferrochelatase [Novimethylophilus kurashikiensis]|uniref:Ferrochelatase n=1 Tax=Novimethylophilus kurashikiensis TaxID=1825523 RepID=A0A2R5F918_9PROT|nr:ferrochelatase [Novimethylophilus kurashikiensis]GBG13413.1 ferrochelatase [Novimethylophilus kurashikiensis]
MANFLPEPSFAHGSKSRVGILLLNLGTPDEPTAPALRRYLKQFLSDPRVVEIPKAVWWVILNAFILPFRPQKSAEKYAQIWTSDGSPLMVHAQRQAKLLQGYLGNALGQALPVELGMSYGNPSVASAIAKLREQGCDRILVFPLFPQYAASSTASAFDAVFKSLLKTRNLPELRTIKQYHDHPAYIAALADSVRKYWMVHGKPEKLIMSFHGIPRRSLDLGDPYHCFCHKTGRLLAEALGLNAQQYMVCFQSRFGRAEWLKPYFAPTLEDLGKQRVKRVDVICPGFSSDCLETLEEIAMEGKATFLAAGGSEYHYIPALNEREEWIQAMVEIVKPHLQGWVEPERVPDAAELEQSRLRALAMGAKN